MLSKELYIRGVKYGFTKTRAGITKKLVEEEGRKCITIYGDIGNEPFCQDAVAKVIDQLGRLDILVNNAAEQCSRTRTNLDAFNSK
jgi:NAD(P)-dependent dehydrogenase (short-subunit alcohol dehydrogenase family)